MSESKQWQSNIQQLLGRCYRAFSPSAAKHGYEIIVLAVPRSPGNIEAVCNAFDQETLVELLDAFLTQMKGSENVITQSDDGGGADHADSAPGAEPGGTDGP
jgi:hypothetical protein